MLSRKPLGGDTASFWFVCSPVARGRGGSNRRMFNTPDIRRMNIQGHRHRDALMRFHDAYFPLFQNPSGASILAKDFRFISLLWAWKRMHLASSREPSDGAIRSQFCDNCSWVRRATGRICGDFHWLFWKHKFPCKYHVTDGVITFVFIGETELFIFPQKVFLVYQNKYT